MLPACTPLDKASECVACSSRAQPHLVLPGDLPEVPEGDLAVISGHLRERVPEPLYAAGQLHLVAVARGGELLSRLQQCALGRGGWGVPGC